MPLAAAVAVRVPMRMPRLQIMRLAVMAVVVLLLVAVLLMFLRRLSGAALELVLRRRLHRPRQGSLAGVHGGDGTHHGGVVRVLVRARRLLVARRGVGLAAAPLKVPLIRALNQVVDQLQEGGWGGVGGVGGGGGRDDDSGQGRVARHAADMTWQAGASPLLAPPAGASLARSMAG